MTLLLAASLAFIIAVITAPIGISGAVFLMPVQLSILHTPSPAITPTNLFYNLIAIPGGLLRYKKHASIHWPLTKLLIIGTVPGTIIGACIRVWWLSDQNTFLIVVACVLIPLGIWLVFGKKIKAHRQINTKFNHSFIITFLAFIVGGIGGIYGIGGGSILAPILVGIGFAVVNVAPAALTATFATSIVGLITYIVLSIFHHGNIAPDWALGIALGVGGFIGTYVGAMIQPLLPETILKKLLGTLAIFLGIYYIYKVIYL